MPLLSLLAPAFLANHVDELFLARSAQMGGVLSVVIDNGWLVWKPGTEVFEGDGSWEGNRVNDIENDLADEMLEAG